MRFPGTLSARIIIGFAVLIVTFGGISLSAVLTTDQLNSTIRAIRVGYLQLALGSRDLSEKQQGLLSYLREELTTESTPRRVEMRLRRLREPRDKFLVLIEKTLAELPDIPVVHARDIRRAAADVREIRALVGETEPLYAQLLADPPLDKLIAPPGRTGAGAASGRGATNPGSGPGPVEPGSGSGAAPSAPGPAPPASGSAPSAPGAGPATPPVSGSVIGGAAPPEGREPAAVSAGESALRRLKSLESRINAKTLSLEHRQRDDVQDTARGLERGARKMRLLTILWGAIALVVGLLITIWATVNLRPLRRLRDAAREIARGDYGQRIEERGPREVADLAREFNTMGSAIQEREHELVRTERLAAVGKMAAMIAHEVRNPLSSIGLNTELLEEEISELTSEHGDRATEARSLCRAIQSELDRLTAITEEYLHFARLPKPKLQEEALGTIVKSIVDFERESMSARGISLEVDLADDLPPVMVDEAQLRQALLNLLRNAGEAVAEVGSGRVKVHTRRGAQPRTAEVVVEDDGPGIVEELAGKIFDPFFSTREGGTGLGLALTHQIVRDHGGTIRVESQPGHGASFIVSLLCRRQRAVVIPMISRGGRPPPAAAGPDRSRR
ncbi:MAG TPA: ATP-binding protein [Kofleriaceae bacterium]|nr:ATP-binding protein [Kofleriaceae bacterium]